MCPEKRILCFVLLSCLKYWLAVGLIAPAILHGAERSTASAELIRFQGPEKLRFDDLVTLAAIDPPRAELQARLEGVLEQPFISNEATLSGTQSRPSCAELALCSASRSGTSIALQAEPNSSWRSRIRKAL